MKPLTVLTCMLATAALTTAVNADTTVTFDNGNEGWTIQNAVTIAPTGGNPGPFLDHFQIDTFGITVANSTSPEFIGDYSLKGPVVVSADFQVDRIWTEFFGDVARDLVIEFRDYDLGIDGYPYSSVWTNVGLLQTGLDWTTFSAKIEDPTATELPAGWGGYGAEDPHTFEPILPAGVTFADVMAGVDEVVFTTFVPGYVYGFTNFDFGVDNISIVSNAVPAPGALALLGLAGLRRTRRRS